MYEYRAEIIRVVDGDTVDVLVDLGMGIQKSERLRITATTHKYFDTPETFRPKSEAEKIHGKQANARAAELLIIGQYYIIRTQKDKRGGRGRYLATIELENGIDFGTQMISEGFQKKSSYVE